MRESSGVIGYFARNPVAANLLMAFLLIMGVYSWFGIQKQVFSTAEDNHISIFISWPGASPLEVEQNITVKIEQALQGITALRNVYSDTGNTYVYFNLEVKVDESIDDVLSEVKRKLDTISTFPGDMEPPVVDKFHWNQSVMRLVIQGPSDELQLKDLGQEVQNELLQLQNVELVDFYDLPSYEVAIEIDPMKLRQYGMDLDTVARNIQLQSANLSAGSIKMAAGELFIRLSNRAYRQRDFASIPVLVGPQGQSILLGQIANISDGLSDQFKFTRFNGELATSLHVLATSEQSMPVVADSIYKYVEKKNAELPEGVGISVFSDATRYLDERINLMLNNLLQGAVFVFLVLAVFLRARVAFWVMMGVPVVFLGTIFLMPFFNVAINVTSLFAFIMALGIVVDDAIVISESAYSECEKNGHSVRNIIKGTRRVATPVTFGVLTTVVVFMPLLFAKGSDSGQFIDLSVVVICCLLLSLVESKLILPAHLAHGQWRPVPENHWRRRVDTALQRFIEQRYQPFLRSCIRNKYLTTSVFVGVLAVSASLVSAGWLQIVFLPKVAADTPIIRVAMNANVSEQQTQQIMQGIEGVIHASDHAIEQQHGQAVVDSILAIVPERGRGELHIALVDEDQRPVDAFDLSRVWYDKILAINGVKSVEIQDEAVPSGQGAGFGYRFYGEDIDQLNQAALEFSQAVAAVQGVYNLGSSVDPSVRELSFTLRPSAYALGLDAVGVAQQINHGFFGNEVDRIAREGNDIRVMVRYPQSLREQKSALKYTAIKTPDGREVMLGDVVDLYEKQGVKTIRREKGYRSVVVWGGIDENITTSDEVLGLINNDIMPSILDRHPGVKTDLSGAIVELQEQRSEMLQFGLMALVLVYVLLAIPLKSYTSPLLVMVVIPFSLIGSTWGHFLLGHQLSLFSIFGLIAAIGVVVNDSLLFLDGIQQERAQGNNVVQSVLDAARSRFRAIMITSATTFVGLAPIMTETSVQGQYVAPMAVSLAFALVVSTFTSLILLPCLYLIFHRDPKPAVAVADWVV